MGGSPTSLWREHAPKNTFNLKNRASLANKATVSVSLLSEFSQLVRFPKEQDRI